MELTKIIGHEVLRARFAELQAAKTFPQVSIFHGTAGIGKKIVAQEVMLRLVCESSVIACGTCASCQQALQHQHPDLFWIAPTPPKSQTKKKDNDGSGTTKATSTNLTIKVEDVENVKKRLRHQPLQGQWQGVIIEEAHLMTETTANSLLKLLEEPRPHQIFILVTSQFHRILTTLRSRSAKFHFGALSPAEIAKIFAAQPETRAALDPSFRDFLATAFEGSVGSVLQAVDSGLTPELIRSVLSRRGSFSGVQAAVRAACDSEVNLRQLLQCLRAQVLQTARLAPDSVTLAFLDRVSDAERRLAKHLQKEFVLENLLM